MRVPDVSGQYHAADGSGSITELCFQQSLEEISLEDRNLQLETLKGDLHTVIEAISQSSAKQKGKDFK